MPRTPDRKPGPLEEDEELQFEANPVPPTKEGAMNYNGSEFVMYDSDGLFNPRSAASFNDIILDEAGKVVYVNDGEFVLRS
jgi:hypothetical protein